MVMVEHIPSRISDRLPENGNEEPDAEVMSSSAENEKNNVFIILETN